MHIYLAGCKRAWREDVVGERLLVSFASPHECNMVAAGWDVAGWMLDSGAFSAWNAGRLIDLDAYMAFIEAHHHLLDAYVALDVIPGEPGRRPTPDEAQRATEQSFMNLEKMMAAGLRPIPVYHEGEPIDVLDELVRQGHGTIGLGATASRGKPKILDWLIPIFQRHPTQRFHGLAMTQRRVIEWLPFHSVDSTSWLNFAKYGLAANLYLLKDRTNGFMRRLGKECLLDIPRCPASAPVAHEGQLIMFDRPVQDA